MISINVLESIQFSGRSDKLCAYLKTPNAFHPVVWFRKNNHEFQIAFIAFYTQVTDKTVTRMVVPCLAKGSLLREFLQTM